MKTTIDVDLRPFDIPIGALLVHEPHYDAIIIPLHLVPLDDLVKLCEQFTKDILEAAGYEHVSGYTDETEAP